MFTISVSLHIFSVAPAILLSPTNILFTHLTFLARNSEFFANSLLNKELFLSEQPCTKLFSELHMHNMEKTHDSNP